MSKYRIDSTFFSKQTKNILASIHQDSRDTMIIVVVERYPLLSPAMQHGRVNLVGMAVPYSICLEYGAVENVFGWVQAVTFCGILPPLAWIVSLYQMADNLGVRTRVRKST
jgi:hypothetical protein